jgi:bifunctional phosphoglucose/phosphomannose isomerase
LKPIKEQYLEWPHMLSTSYQEALSGIEEPLMEAEGRLVVGCGMGGSGFSLNAVSPLVEERRPYVIVKGDSPPRYLSRHDILVGVSYSGETLETISCFRRGLGVTGRAGVVAGGGSTLAMLAKNSGSSVVEVEKKGHPRSSLAQLVGGLLALLFGEEANEVVTRASQLLDSERALRYAGNIAAILYNDGNPLIPVVVSCGDLGFVAERWATEFSENSKHPALYEVYPEAGHNFIARWYYTRGPYQVIYIDFEGGEGICGIAKKYVLSKYPSTREPIVLDYTSLKLENPLAGVLEAALTAGLASVELAEKLGRNPEVIEAIDEYKRMAKGEY